MKVAEGMKTPETPEELKEMAGHCAYCGKPITDSFDNRMANSGENYGWAAHRICFLEAQVKMLTMRLNALLAKLPGEERRRILQETAFPLPEKPNGETGTDS